MAESTRKIGLLVGNDFEDMEVMYPYYRLLEAGFRVDLIGEDMTGTKYLGKNGYPVTSTTALSQVVAKSYAGLVVPGGWMPDKLRRNSHVLALVSEVHNQGGVIASICHGPWILISAGTVKGKRMTSTVALKDDLTNAGATWVDEEVVVDGKLVTSRKPDDLPAFMRSVLRVL